MLQCAAAGHRFRSKAEKKKKKKKKKTPQPTKVAAVHDRQRSRASEHELRFGSVLLLFVCLPVVVCLLFPDSP
jgi:hypothetical protein